MNELNELFIVSYRATYAKTTVTYRPNDLKHNKNILELFCKRLVPY